MKKLKKTKLIEACTPLGKILPTEATWAWAEQCLRQAEERMAAKRHVAAAVWVGEATAAIRLLPEGSYLPDEKVTPDMKRRLNLQVWAGRLEREILAATDFCPHCKRLVSP